MTREEQNLNWDAILESGSMTAVHNIREYIKYLEKELAISKVFCDSFSDDLKELKEKLKGFENGDVAWQGDMDRTIKQNLELKAQIECEHKQYLEVRDKLEKQIDYNIELGRKTEKLRCCGNCKHAVYSDAIIIDCYKDYGECKNFDKWEMKE